MDPRTQLQRRADQVARQLRDHVSRRDPLCIIKAPPGSGKTHTLLDAVVAAYARGERVAVATQTNAQADDIGQRLVDDHPHAVEQVWRFTSSKHPEPADLDPRIVWCSQTAWLPDGPCIVVANTSKWGLVSLAEPFDILFVDEAWQMASCDFMLLQQVAPRFVLIGDPGQIAPVVSIPVHRWETSPRAPHRAAPEALLAEPALDPLLLELPACRRLPADSVDLVRPFYDFSFDAWARPGERGLRGGSLRKRTSSPVDPVIDRLTEHSAAIATLPTPDGGPPLDEDEPLARLAAAVATRALDRRAAIVADDDGTAAPLTPLDIGISATHRTMNSALLRALPVALRDPETGIRIDTPERWQGLQRKFMIIVHPLSGVVHPSAFDLETGRLCVMASRHRGALVVVSRDHVPATLDALFPTAEQPLGRPDASGRGHHQHDRFWQTIAERRAVVSCH